MIWIIGHKGMLGSEVESRLKGKTHVSTDREVDIANFESLAKFARQNDLASKVTHVINCAAYTQVDLAESDPKSAYLINKQGAFNVAKIAAKLDATLLHVSTDYVFDGRKRGRYLEDDTPCPLSVYGKSKLEGEKDIANTWKKHYIVRIAWLYGKNGKNFVSTMLTLFKERKRVAVVDDQTGSPTSAIDVAEALLHVTKNKAPYGIYHFTNKGEASWYEFACRIYKRSEDLGMLENEVQIDAIPTSHYPTPAQRPANSRFSLEKIENAFKIDIRGWQEALDEFLWTLKQGRPIDERE